MPSETEELAKAFESMETVEDLARLLNVSFRKFLVYYLYRVPETARYLEFDIKKRNGGTRRISAPATNLKLIQQRLNVVLRAVYRPKPSVHGFVARRNIMTNAEGHVRKKYVMNIDLENFFDSINFGRVRGMFMAQPYHLPPPVATVLAQICCHGNKLPQGAPTSPIVSNMICSKLDSQLRTLAASRGCQYGRYADDITFSTNRNTFPNDIGIVDAPGGAEGFRIGDKLRMIIEANGFSINPTKSRVRTRSQRQEVTGLLVNRFVNVDRRYVRNLRALLHAWRIYGVEALQGQYVANYDNKSRFPDKPVPSVVQVAYGRIQYLGAVRGWDDPVYKRLRDAFNELSSRKIRVPTDSWLEMLKSATWVIEDEDLVLQGTAFFLRGYGLITCNHCVGARPYIYHPAEPSKHYRVKAEHRHADVDLAILKPVDAVPKLAELAPQAFESTVQYEDTVTLVGYPGHAPGKELSIKRGEVQSFTIKSSIRRFNISAPVVAGNSGGPVIGRTKRVIGIAVTGSDRLDLAATTEEHGVIPVGALAHLLPEAAPIGREQF